MDHPNSTMETYNTSSSTGLLPHHKWHAVRLVAAVMFSLFFLVGVPGNVAVIILRPNWQHLSSLSQSLLMNLAVCDLLFLMTLLFRICSLFYSWTWGLVTCKILAYVVHCTINGSLMTVTGLSIQRYLMVVHRQRCQQVQRRLVLILLWMVTFILSTPALVVHQVVTVKQWQICKPQFSSNAQWLASLMTKTVFGFLSLFLVAFSYLRLKRTVSQSTFFNNPRTTRLVTRIIVSFFVLWVPYHTINVLGVVAICLNNESLKKFYIHTRHIVVPVIFVNCCLNLLLYAFNSCKICTVCQKDEPMQQMRSIPQAAGISTSAELL